MANAILNFHFDYSNPSLIQNPFTLEPALPMVDSLHLLFQYFLFVHSIERLYFFLSNMRWVLKCGGIQKAIRDNKAIKEEQF